MARSLRLAVAFLTLLGCAALAWAQVPDTLRADPTSETVLEALEGAGDGGEQLAEWLTDLLENPLDVNTATAVELAQLPPLSPLLAQRIVAFRAAFGPFGSIPELRAVEGITAEVFLQIRPYLRIGPRLPVPMAKPSPYPPPPPVRVLLSEARPEVIQRITRQWSDTGEENDLGSPARIYTRLRLRHQRHLSLNLTLEKDPGETFRWDPGANTYGYDFASAHVALTDFGRIRTLIVGDYYLTAGQGLLFWRSTGTRKGSDTVRPIPRAADAVRPYGSTDENRFFRGAATTIRLHPSLDLSLFVSRHHLDARLHTMGDSTALFATSLDETGLHRTDTELARKDALRETLWGGQIRWSQSGKVLGLQGYQSRYTHPFRPSDLPALRFQLHGHRTAMISAFGLLPVGDLLFYGEVAASKEGTFGAVGGVLVESDRAFQGVLAWRHFPRDFVSPHGAALGERSGTPNNETGFYLGLRLRPHGRLLLQGYVDQYRFPWSQRLVSMPATGIDALLRVEVRPYPWLLLYVQARSETKDAGRAWTTPQGTLEGVAPQTRQSLRLHTDYHFSRTLLLRSRVEGIRFAAESAAFGLLLFQDIRWAATRFLRLEARLAFFDSEAFGARVFMYEHDLLYTFAVPAFNGRGDRAYLLATLQPFSSLRLQFKFAATRQLDESLQQNRLTRALRAQLIWRPER